MSELDDKTPAVAPVNRNCYIVRSSDAIPLEDGVVGIGYAEIEFRRYESGDAIVQDFPNIIKDWSLGRRANQIRRFKGIKKGDVVIVPFRGCIIVGIARGEEHFDPAYSRLDGANQHRVDFLRDPNGNICKIPRVNLSEAFQKRLKIRITVAWVEEFRKEIDALISSIKTGEGYSYVQELSRKDQALKEGCKQRLLARIRCGQTGLATGGVGLEHLVKELLEVNGYKAEIQGKRTFQGIGDADIVASKPDILHPEGGDEYLIQVKHHDGTTGSWGQQQLLKIKELQAETFAGHKLVLVSSGSFSEELKRSASENDIAVVDGEQLVGWIFESIEKLSEGTKLRLTISFGLYLID